MVSLDSGKSSTDENAHPFSERAQKNAKVLWKTSAWAFSVGEAAAASRDAAVARDIACRLVNECDEAV